MAKRRDISFTPQTAAHRLGQYNAWRLASDAKRPFDMVWTSVAHATSPAAHRVLPHGEPSIAVLRQRDANGDVTNVDLTICGPFRHAKWYHPKPREELIAIRLKPEMAAAIFGVAPGDHFDAAPSAAEKQLRDACATTLQLCASGEVFEIARALLADLRRVAADKTGGATPETNAARILRRTNGMLNNADLARRLGVSERHLRRRFVDHLGCSPKTYARQLRLTATALAAESKKSPNWAQLAATTGFHDQAHMINEFKAMAKVTPRDLHLERRALTVLG